MDFSAIKTRFLRRIAETADDTHFSDTNEILDLANEGQRMISLLLEWGKDELTIAAVEGQQEYTIAESMLYIQSAYFGNKTISGDVRPLTVITEQVLKQLNPQYLETTSAIRGRPTRLIISTRTKVLLDPTPNATESVSGKNIILKRVYNPTDMSSDSSTPDLPLVYHDLLPVYMAHLAYGSAKLNNSQRSTELYNEFMTKHMEVRRVVTMEAQEAFGFKWGYKEE